MRFSRRGQAISCRRAVQLITDYLDDALPATQRAILERHLGDCPYCAAYLAQLRTTIAATGRLAPGQITPQMRDTLVELYRQSRQSGPGRPGRQS